MKQTRFATRVALHAARHRSLGLGLMLSFASLTAPAAAETTQPEVGKAVVVKESVSIEYQDEKKPLTKNATVHQDEAVVTQASSSAEIELLDKTKLAVGPDARIVLDKFVYDAGASPGSISINLSKGAFRFVTGLSPKASYVIKTPTATMGVRGTVFDVFVADNGETAVLLHEGGVDVCSSPGTCQRHDRVGKFLVVNLARAISFPLKWDGALTGTIAAAAAFPFVGKRLVLDPVRRLGGAKMIRQASRVVTTPIRQGSKVVTKPVRALSRAIGRPRLPF